MGSSSSTPAKERDDGCTSLGDKLSTTNILEDDFGDSILEEIDAFCDRKLSHSGKADIGLPAPGSIDFNTVSVHIPKNNSSHKFVQNEDALQFIPEGVLYSLATKAINLPQQYSKYLESLNERQREAAFSDTATPLMIVAGPGSGKARIIYHKINLFACSCVPLVVPHWWLLLLRKLRLFSLF